MNHVYGKNSLTEKEIWHFTSITIKVFLTLLAVSDSTLVVLDDWWYKVDMPVVKHIFTVFSAVSERGILAVFAALALGYIYHIVQIHHKNPWVSGFSVIAAVSSVFGKSYMYQGNWNYIFFRKEQFILAVLVMTGYYFLYKNMILLLIQFHVRYKDKIFRRYLNRLETRLFEGHVFIKSFFIFLILGLPYLICFFPGTMQWDALEQLHEYFGITEMTGQQPVAVTMLMGMCMECGRKIFHSDSVGLFLYTGPQFLIQCLVFAYTIYVLCKNNTPVLIRWGALILFGVYPIFPIWGYTLVKDTGYYIFTLLFLTVIFDVLCCDKKTTLRQNILFIISAVCISLFRNNGRYVIILTVLFALFAYRKFWKFFVVGAAFSLAAILMLERLYMPLNGIRGGQIKEMLSIPLQQTARYIKEHGDDITLEERAVLSDLFLTDIESLGKGYNGEISDPVKWYFVPYPSPAQLKSYFKVWFQQLIRHPETYIQAFIHHTYGYFYPDRDNFWDRWGVYALGSGDVYQEEANHLYLAFGMKNPAGRNLLRETANLIYNFPVLGILYSCGFWTYLQIGLAMWLTANKKRKELLIMMPSLVMLLICMASPVDAYFRYMLPIVVALPINLAWCCHVGQEY